MTKDSCEYFFCKARWWLEIISYSIKAATVDHDKDCHYHLHRNRHHHHHGHRQCWCQVAELKEIMTKMGERFTETQVREMVSLIFHYYHHHHHHHHGYPANSIKLCLCSWRIWPQWSKSMQVEVADVEGKGVIDYEAFASLLTAHRNWLNIKPFFFSDVFRCNLISITFPCRYLSAGRPLQICQPSYVFVSQTRTTPTAWSRLKIWRWVNDWRMKSASG